jgi:soluble P-type ATPase
LRNLFKNTQPGSQRVFLVSAARIKQILIAALNHDYSKVVAIGLSVTGSFFHTLLDTDCSFKASYKPLI